jgi:predicted transcriptional regulator
MRLFNHEGGLCLHFSKANFGIAPQDRWLKRTDSGVLERTDKPAKYSERKAQENNKSIIETLQDEGVMTVAQLEIATNLSKKTVLKYINEEIKRGYIVKEGSGKSTTYKIAPGLNTLLRGNRGIRGNEEDVTTNNSNDTSHLF